MYCNTNFYVTFFSPNIVTYTCFPSFRMNGRTCSTTWTTANLYSCSTPLYPVVSQFYKISTNPLNNTFFVFSSFQQHSLLNLISHFHRLSLLQCVTPEEMTFHTGSTQQLRALKNQDNLSVEVCVCPIYESKPHSTKDLDLSWLLMLHNSKCSIGPWPPISSIEGDRITILLHNYSIISLLLSWVWELLKFTH